MTYITETSKKGFKKGKRLNMAMQAALIKDPKAGIHINKRKSGKRNFSGDESSDGDDIIPKHKRTRGRQKDKQISKKKNIKASGKKSHYNQYASESDSSEEDSISGDSDSDEEPNDEDNSIGGDSSSDEDSNNQEPSDTDPSDEEPRGRDASDEDVSQGCYEVSSDEEYSDGEDSVQKLTSQDNENEYPSTNESSKSKQRKEKGDQMKGLPNQDVENIDSNGGSPTNGGFSNEEDDSVPSTKDSSMSKKPRGPTNPTPVLDSSCKKKIEFNGRGQPIGENSVSLSTVLGNIASEMVPLNFNDWRKIPKDHKDLYWFTIQRKFIINEKLGLPYALKEIGKLWRARKSRIRRKIRACKSKKELQALRKKCGVQKSDWKIFRRNMANRAYTKKSKKFQELRAMQNLPHTCSRKGYARLEDELKKASTDPSSITRSVVWVRGHTKRNGEPSNARVARKMKKIQEIQDSMPTNSSPQSIDNDPLSQVLGPDRYGRARALGSGGAPSKLELVPQHMAIITQYEERFAAMEQDVKRLTNLVNSQHDLINTLIAKQQGQSVGSGQYTQLLAAFSPTSTNPSPTYFAGSSPTSSTPNIANPVASVSQVNERIAKNSKCQLMNWLKPNEIVAFGRWETSDPTVKVHFKSLGEGASRVWVDNVVAPISLWRQTTDDEIQTLSDVVGSAIAWPTDCIHLIEEVMANGGDS